MHEGQPRGAFTSSRDDQGRDLDDLAIAARGGAGASLCVGEMGLGGGGVTVVRGHEGESGVRDRVHVSSGAPGG